MLTCPQCSAVADDGASTCPSCGAALTGTQATVRRPSPNNKTPKSSQQTSGSRFEGKYLAGTILNDRYRITGLIGRGGMGEVSHNPARAWLRRDWLAAVVTILIFALGALTSSSRSFGVAGLIAASLLVVTFMRFGLLALFAALVVNDWLLSLPLTTNFSTWYAGTSLFGMIVVIVLAVYVFYISLGGQKLFTRNPLED